MNESGAVAAYAVPRELLVDYVRTMEETLPAIRRLNTRYRALLYQDSVLIDDLKRRIALHERNEVDMDRLVSLYREETDKRKSIDRLYASELGRSKWWRRGAVAAVGAGIVFAIVR